MRFTKSCLAVLALIFAVCSCTWAQDPGWPRKLVQPGGTVIIYQPQVDDWQSLTDIKWRSAFQLTPIAGKQVVGAATFETTTEVNSDTHTVFMFNIQVLNTYFPSLDPATSAQMNQLFGTIRNLKAMEGRILLHDEDEVNGRRYLLLESTDAKVRLIYHTREIEEARRAGKLAVNTFARLQKRFIDGVPSINISDYGDANTLLKNHSFFAERAQSSSRDGTEAHYTTWGGWLGQYYARLQSSTQAERAPARSHQPRQKNSLGRG